MLATGRRLAHPIGPGTVSIARHVLQMVLLILLQLPLAGMSTTTSLGISYGEGKHIIILTNPEGFAKVDMPPSQEVSIRHSNGTSSQIYVGGVVVYSFTVIFIKLSILYLYHRIFPSRGLVIAACLIAILVMAYNAALIIFAFLQCIPLSKLWTGKPEGVCVPTKPAYVTLAYVSLPVGEILLKVNSVMNVVTDIMILCLPVKFVLRLQMKTTRKLQVLGAFDLGGM